MPALDGLRAVAVLLVFVGHSFPTSGFPGGVGVDVFFVISGYLITLILLKEFDKTGRLALGTFYLRRALRLFPPLLAVVAVVLACWWLFDTTFVNQAVRSLVALTYTTNIVLTVSDTPMGALQHTWSLALEEQFYLVWPLLLLVLLNRKWSPRAILWLLGVLAAASTIAWIIMGGEDLLPYNPLTKAGGLLIGCMTAFVVRARPRQSSLLAYAAVAIVGGSLVLGSFGMLSTAYSHPIVTLATPFIIAHLAFGQGPLVAMLSYRPIVRLGVTSYAFYLCHFPILVALFFNTDLPQWACGVIGLVMTVVAAELSMRFVEAPALRLKERIAPVRIVGNPHT